MPGDNQPERRRSASSSLSGSIGRRIGTGVMLCGAVSTGLIFVALLPVLPLIATHFGEGSGGALFAQSVMTMPAVGLIAGGLTAIWLIERIGAFHLLWPALLAVALLGSAGLYLNAPVPLLATRLLLGFFASMASIATTALIAQRFDAEARPRMLGYKGAVTSISSMGGLLLAGWLGDIGGWRLPFALYLLAAALAILALLTLDRDPPLRREASTAAKGDILALWPVYGTVVLFGAVMMMTNTQFSFLLAEIGIHSPAMVSRTVVVTIIVSALAAFLYGRVRGWIGAAMCFPLIVAGWCIGLLILGFAYDGMTAAIGAGIAGLSAGFFPAHMATTLVERASPAARDRAIALMYSAIYLGDFLNPFLIEPLSMALTRHGAFRAVGLFCGVVLIILLLRHRATAFELRRRALQ